MRFAPVSLILSYERSKLKVLVDRGPWYPWALNELSLEWEHVTFGRRNRVERWFGYFKARVKAFGKSFPL